MELSYFKEAEVRPLRSCPFPKRSLLFLRHLENFLPVIESVSIKKKEIVTQGRNWTSNPNLSYPDFSALPSYTTTPTPQNSAKIKYIH